MKFKCYWLTEVVVGITVVVSQVGGIEPRINTHLRREHVHV